jgi:hypothetical protein
MAPDMRQAYDASAAMVRQLLESGNPEDRVAGARIASELQTFAATGETPSQQEAAAAAGRTPEQERVNRLEVAWKQAYPAIVKKAPWGANEGRKNADMMKARIDALIRQGKLAQAEEEMRGISKYASER